MVSASYTAAERVYEDVEKVVRKEILPIVNQHIGMGKEKLSSLSGVGPIVYNLYDNVMSSKDLLNDVTNSVSQVTGVVSQPVTINVLSDKFVFENGFIDVTIYTIMSILVGYVVIYRFLLQIVLWKVGVKFMLCTVIYKFLFLCKIVMGFIFSLLSFAFGISLFLAKLACCCGCCGMCFRRSSSQTKKMTQAFQGNSNRNSNNKNQSGNQQTSKLKKRK